MHHHHELLVEADTAEEANDAAAEFLKEYEGHVWDWYAKGGRWSGYHFSAAKTFLFRGTLELPYEEWIQPKEAVPSTLGDTICLAELGPELFNAIRLSQTATMAAQVESLIAALTTGLAHHYRPATAEPTRTFKLVQWLRQEAERVRRGRSEYDPPHTELQKRASKDMLSYRLGKTADCLSGFYTTESYFYDTVYGGSFPSEEHHRAIWKNPSQHWLVTVDIHN
jgi:hypothetical protein